MILLVIYLLLGTITTKHDFASFIFVLMLRNIGVKYFLEDKWYFEKNYRNFHKTDRSTRIV